MKFNSIENKFLLLDSNVVINYSRFYRFYQGMFDEIAEHNVRLAIDPFVRFEVLRFAENKTEREDLEEKLFDLFDESDFSMPIANQELYDLATKVSNYYQANIQRSSKISAIDIFLAARLISFTREGQEQSLFLATENHKDFPQELFERIGVYTIDRGDQIQNVGFYQAKEGVLDVLD